MYNVFITGASSGIGRACAELFLEKGCNVFVVVRDDESFNALQKSGAKAYLCDVRDYKTIDAIFQEFDAKDIRIDALFNNAGYGQPGAVEDITTEALKAQFETNFFALHYISVKAIALMRKQGRGKIIQHSSVLGLISLRFRGAYNASKYAVEGLCDTLRLELAQTDIKIVTLNTGPVTSKFRDNATAMFEKNVDISRSCYKNDYEKELAQRLKSQDKAPFTLTSQDVAHIVYAIICAKNPKPRYYITKATYLLGFFKRIFSTRLLDKVLVRI